MPLTVQKTLANNFAGVGDQDKCAWFNRADMLPKGYSLRTPQRRKYNIFFPMRISALRLADSGAAVQFMNDITTDRLRIVADNIEIFAKVDAFNHIVNHQ